MRTHCETLESVFFHETSTQKGHKSTHIRKKFSRLTTFFDYGWSHIFVNFFWLWVPLKKDPSDKRLSLGDPGWIPNVSLYKSVYDKLSYGEAF